MHEEEPRLHQSEFFEKPVPQLTDSTKLRMETLQEDIKKDQRVIKEAKNVFVGTGFTFDLT